VGVVCFHSIDAAFDVGQCEVTTHVSSLMMIQLRNSGYSGGSYVMLEWYMKFASVWYIQIDELCNDRPSACIGTALRIIHDLLGCCRCRQVGCRCSWVLWWDSLSLTHLHCYLNVICSFVAVKLVSITLPWYWRQHWCSGWKQTISTTKRKFKTAQCAGKVLTAFWDALGILLLKFLGCGVTVLYSIAAPGGTCTEETPWLAHREMLVSRSKLWSNLAGTVLPIHHTARTFHTRTFTSSDHRSSTLKRNTSGIMTVNAEVCWQVQTWPSFLLCRNWTGDVPQGKCLDYFGNYMKEQRISLLLHVLLDVCVEVIHKSVIHCQKLVIERLSSSEIHI
jgi:hypothetical protein